MEIDIQQVTQLVQETMVPFGIRLLGGLAILIGGWLLARIMGGWVRRTLDRTPKMDDTLKPFFVRLTRISILAFTVLAMLNKFGVQTASLIAVFGAAGLAIGLALQGTLSQFAAGVMLLIFRPFKVGDVVNVAGHTGQVVEIGLFATELRPPDGVFILVPNGTIWGSDISNFTRNGTRRVSMTFGIGYGDDMDQALGLIRKIVTAEPRMLAEPEPGFLVSNLGDSSVDLTALFWVQAADYIAIQGDIRKTVKEEFDAAGVNIPFPQMDVHLIKE